MEAKKLLRTYALVFLLGFLAVAAIIASQTISEDELSSEDSAAIYGGELERGYPSAGYLVSENTDDLFNYCSIVNVGRGKALTAAHCIENTKRLKIGFETFTFGGENKLEVERIYRSAQWDGQNLSEDFAVIEYNLNNEQSKPNASIHEPQTGCNYRVVGYGRTEEDESGLLEKRPRKSAQICIDQVDEYTFILTGKDGGICTGDSGSPIYVGNTDIVVGIISSIITTSESKGQPCFIGNTAVAVRTDSQYQSFDENSENDAAFVSREVTPATDLFDDFVEATGTEDIFTSKENVLLFVGAVVGLIMILALMSKLLNRR